MKEESSLLNRIVNLGAFAILSLLWLVFALALIFNWALLDSVWSAFRSWPLAVQLLAGLLFSPVVAGLWIWETSWPVFLRVILVTGLGWATFFAFDPRHLLYRQVLSEKTAVNSPSLERPMIRR
jgi:hypothetical protein